MRTSRFSRAAIFDPHTFGHGKVWHDFNPLSETLFNATPLILVGLSVGLAFRTGLFNIGGQGQIILGAMLAGYVGFPWHLPPVLHLVVAMVAGRHRRCDLGGIAGWLKARTGAHEVISTIMMNYVAFNLLAYVLKTGVFRRPGPTKRFRRSCTDRRGWGSCCRPRCGSTSAWSIALAAAAIVPGC